MNLGFNCMRYKEAESLKACESMAEVGDLDYMQSIKDAIENH